MSAGDESYGPCHACGVETDDRHGTVLVGCCPIAGSDHVATTEWCDQCYAELRAGVRSGCPELGHRVELAR